MVAVAVFELRIGGELLLQRLCLRLHLHFAVVVAAEVL